MKRILSLIILLYGGGLYAQTLDSGVYKEVKKILILTNHQREADVKRNIDGLTNEPAPYLVALSADPGLRVYAKQKAIALLQYYPTSATEAFLRAKIADATTHQSLRSSAAHSYATGFYRKDAVRVESFLRQYQRDRSIGLSVLSALRTARIMNKESVPDEKVIQEIRKQRRPLTKDQQ